MKKTISISLLAALAAFSANADKYYYVDGGTYFGTPDSDTMQNNARDFNSNTQNVSSSAYNWAKSYTTGENGVPSYNYYTDAASVPGENDDVIIDFGSNVYSPKGSYYSLAGSPRLNSDTTINSLTIGTIRNHWLMFKANDRNFTIKGDLNYNSNQLSYIELNYKSALNIGGTLNMKGSNGNPFILGGLYSGAKEMTVNKIVFHTDNSNLYMGLNNSSAGYHSKVLNGADFGATSAKLNLGYYAGKSANQFFAFNGISGTNAAATITTSSANETGLDGTESTLVFTNDKDAAFNGIVTNTVKTITKEGISYNIDTTLNVVMDGSKKQILSGANDFKGTITVKGGTLVLNTASGAKHGILTMTNGAFGAYGNANVEAISYQGGSFYANADAIANGYSITTDGAFTKATEEKVYIDFDGLDASAYDDTYSLITAGSFIDATGNALTAADFAAKNLLNGSANFVFDGNTLKVSFAAVPEPATIAAILGAAALAFAAYRRRK